MLEMTGFTDELHVWCERRSNQVFLEDFGVKLQEEQICLMWEK